jgi:hypothetical protein
MIRILHLVMILALTFGAVIAPDVSSAKVSDVAMAQMNTAEKRCDGCVSPGFTDSLSCEGGCPVPCGSSGTAGIVTWTPSALLAMSFGDIVQVAEPLIPLGTNPSLDPFPPKLPV